MKYLPLLIVVAVVAYVIWLDYRNKQGKAPKWFVMDLPGDRKAVTMPPFGIYVEPDVKNNEEIKKHEQCHWQQYEQKGLIGYYRDYFKLSREHDYVDNPMEKECFNAEKN